MKVTTERLDNCQVNVIVEMDAAEIDEKLRETARKISRQFTVPGYRRGRAPYNAVLRVFGREALHQQALEDFGNELYDKALEQIEYKPYEAGELKEVEWEPFRMTILLPIQPEVDLKDYRAVRVPLVPEPVTEERVSEYVEQLRREHAQWVPGDEPAAFGNQVELDIKGVAGDETIMDHEEYELLLEAEGRQPMPGFHEQIVGLTAGEDKTFVLTVPENDPDEKAAGQEATITVHVHAVKRQELPALDDELGLMVGDYDSLADLQAGVRQNLETEALQRAESQYLDKVVDAMTEAASKIEYPPQAIDREAELILSQMESNLAPTGLQLDRYLAMLGKTRESYKQELHASAEERLRRRLVLSEIAAREHLQVEEEEIDAEIERMSEGMGEQAEAMREMFSSPAGRKALANDMMMVRAQERAIQIGKGEAPPLVEAAGTGEAQVPAAEPVPEAAAEEEAEPEGISPGENEPAEAGPGSVDDQAA